MKDGTKDLRKKRKDTREVKRKHEGYKVKKYRKKEIRTDGREKGKKNMESKRKDKKQNEEEGWREKIKTRKERGGRRNGRIHYLYNISEISDFSSLCF